jgi:Restriction endonuclease
LSKLVPAEVLYIKLGKEGGWEKECIEVEQTLKIGYHAASHEDCMLGKWDVVFQQVLEERKGNARVANSDLRQIKLFYTSNENTLWITFYSGFLWWCHADRKVELDKDGKSKVRKVIGKWSNKDIASKSVSEDHLSGSLLATKGYRDTICLVKEKKYIVNKINCVLTPEVESAQTSRQKLIDDTEKLIRNLHWKDFEVLVDLIFRQAGWKRISRLGEQEKTIDLELLTPIRDSKVGVQVKSRANYNDYNKYRSRLEPFGYSESYFIVHSPHKSLENVDPADPLLKFIGPKQVAKWTVEFGLSDWVVSKNS